MPEIEVYWRGPEFNSEQQLLIESKTRTGKLTTEHAAADDDIPVLVEDVSARVYRPGELPTDTIIYVEGPPESLPSIARNAARAGFVVKPAKEDKSQ